MNTREEIPSSQRGRNAGDGKGQALVWPEHSRPGLCGGVKCGGCGWGGGGVRACAHALWKAVWLHLPELNTRRTQQAPTRAPSGACAPETPMRVFEAAAFAIAADRTAPAARHPPTPEWVSVLCVLTGSGDVHSEGACPPRRVVWQADLKRSTRRSRTQANTGCGAVCVKDQSRHNWSVPRSGEGTSPGGRG